MPRGNPKSQTVASAKWQKKNGYITKGFKMYREQAEEFARACEKAGRSQASVITELMKRFVEENS